MRVAAAADFETKRTRPDTFWPVTRRISAGCADLDAAEIALSGLDHRQHRIERDDLRDLFAGHGEGRGADFGGNVGYDPGPGRAHDAAVALGVRGGERGFRRPRLRFEIAEFELGQSAGFDQFAARFQFRLALRDQRARLRDLRLARLVGKHRDDLILLHELSAPHPQLGQHAGGARHRHHFAVGFGAAGENELAAVLLGLRVHDRDTEQLRRLLLRADGSLAVRRLMRKQIAGPDPKSGGENQPDARRYGSYSFS